MSSSQRICIVYFVILIIAFICAGCGPKIKPPVVYVAPAPEPTIEQPAEEYPVNEDEAGDELYPDGYYIHTVTVPNENISIISNWYTGEQKRWVLLAKCNPNINPNLIFLGNKIKIPRSLMITQTKMPAEFVSQSHSRVQKKAAAKKLPTRDQTKIQAKQLQKEEKPSKPEGEEPLFFGPKGY